MKETFVAGIRLLKDCNPAGSVFERRSSSVGWGMATATATATLISWSSGERAVLVSAFACCVVASVLWAALRWKRPPGKLPPSPPSLPVVGHLHLLGTLPHQSLHRLAAKHGPLMYLRLGIVPTVVASSPDAARELLKTHDHVFCSRPRTAASVITVYNRSDLAWAPHGPYWRRMRQLCVTDLLSPKRMEAFRPLREQEAMALARSVWDHAQAAPGTALQLRPLLSAATYNIISRMAFGERLPVAAEMTELIPQIMQLLGEFHLADYLPFLEWVDPQGCLRRMKAAAKQNDALMQAIIDTRRAEGGAHESTDFLDALLSAASSGSDITDDNIKAILWDMFAGGTDTSALTVEWGLAELLRSPSELAKLREELDAVVGRERAMQEADIPRLPFLQAVVKEVMRLHPAAPLLVPRESMQACHVGGFHIPAKTRALVNVWAIGRDENTWERPLEFLPGRFEGSSVNPNGQHFQLLPFGAGRRACPGWSLGLVSVHMMLGVLVHSFEWSTQQDISMLETFGITTHMAHPLVATPSPRLPPMIRFEGVASSSIM